MILFDTSVVIDARDPDSPFHESEAAVRAANRDAVPALLEGFGMTLVPLPLSAAIPAAEAFAVYLDRLRKEAKRSENRIPLPDFLIGAHAQAEGLKLVTRDPSRVKTYFPKVEIVTP